MICHSNSSPAVGDDRQASDKKGTIQALQVTGGLWYEFKQGSEAALTAIYKRHIQDLYHYGERITSDKELIEDSIHDLFVELWRRRENIGHASSIKFYLYKGLRRKIIKNLVQQRRQPFEGTVPDNYDFEIIFSCEAEKISCQISEEQRETLLQAINSLSRRQKEAVTLKFYDDLTYQEIASIMDMSIRSTYNLIYRALDVLKETVKIVYLLLPFLVFS